MERTTGDGRGFRSNDNGGRGYRGGRGRGAATPRNQNGGRGRGRGRGHDSLQQRGNPYLQSDQTGFESTSRQRGRGGGVGSAGRHGGRGGSNGGRGRGSFSSVGVGFPRTPVPDQHQATQASYQPSKPIPPAPSLPGEYTSQASSSSQPPQNTPPQMTEQFKKLSIQSESLIFPTRPGMGKQGTRCTVKANHFLIKLSVKDFHHYNVSITPEVVSASLNRAVINELVTSYKKSNLGSMLPTYDGRKSLYTAGPLPFVSKEFEVILVSKDSGTSGYRRERKFTVVINLASRIDGQQLSLFLEGQNGDVPQEALQVLDVAMRQSPVSSAPKYTAVKRSFYSATLGRQAIGDGLETWRGFYQSVRSTQMGLSLNIDMSAAVFVEPQEVIKYVENILDRRVSRGRPLSRIEHQKIQKELKGLLIEVTHRENASKKFRISGLTAETTENLTFPVGNTGTTTYVTDYFHETYARNLRYTFLPCLQVGNKKKPIFLPMEVCKIAEGQSYTKRLKDKITDNLVKVNCQHPKDREYDIMKTVRENHYENDIYAEEFGVRVSTNLASVEARILPAPQLIYHNNRGGEMTCKPECGQWNMKNMRMLAGRTVNSWICINFADNLTVASSSNFCHALAEMCRTTGMEFNSEPVLPPRYVHCEQMDTGLNKLRDDALAVLAPHGGDIDLLIAILPPKNGSLYVMEPRPSRELRRLDGKRYSQEHIELILLNAGRGNLKRKCDIELGLVSQCCLENHVFTKKPQYLANVAIKINVKVGGTNTRLSDLPLVTDKPTIIFGADVTHPSSGEDTSPSIAAVVASQDWPNVAKYTCLLSTQAGREEMVQDLHKEWEDAAGRKIYGGMIREHLVSFYKANNHQKPQRIIFYRDGVSEGQFLQVLQIELEAIRKAWNGLDENIPIPPITFVVVQKRHHTRLFPNNHNNTTRRDRSGNILPGTVVDSDICHPSQFDFYLCSHAGIQGTSRPAHYHVLWDDNNFTADQLQTLTNDLCYIYARCTRAVSYVAPAYYAHLAAARARYHLADSSMMDPRDGPADLTRNVGVPVLKLQPLHEKLKRVMFYI